ncbi:DUF2497 domain-containing protein [Sphingosinicella rhizophila]|uniref:DUF2497 domain-containing protein n=1 Tax=Sphingosinicella rhizophila TaxID=3050082 RepID=A0ABU3Q3B8_9SPHN|nr:DUF2497 domain-containing protein [Sphingosinicella sp. GR2756]MDT9597908.1 DUF2497 domain-containing protein [Sphingosinicella sp. GR2756]
MEEILASIKRVIAEDGRQPPPTRPGRAQRPSAPPPVAPEDDVLELSEPMADADSPEDPLISEDAAAASRQALAALSVAHGRGEAAPGDVTIAEGPLEAVVRDMLKPILKDWLDRNLPEIVEELVTREIARITGKSL